MSGLSSIIAHCATVAKQGGLFDNQELSFKESSARIVNLQKIDNDFDFPSVVQLLNDGKSALPECLTERGILGPEWLEGNIIHCSAAGMKESRQIDRVAIAAVSGITGKEHRQGVPGVYYQQQKDEKFIIVRGATSDALGCSSKCQFDGVEYTPAGFVALTDCTVAYPGHHFTKSNEHTLNSFEINGTKLTNQITCESEEAQKLIQELEDNECLTSVDLKAGQMFFTIHGMPCKLSKGALIKFIGLEQVCDNANKRSDQKSKTRESFVHSTFANLLHANNDWLCMSLCRASKLHKEKERPPGYKHASLDDFPEFQPKKGGTRPKKETVSPISDESSINELLEDGSATLATAKGLNPILLNPAKIEPFQKNFDEVNSGGVRTSVKLNSFRTTLSTLKKLIVEAEENRDTKLPALEETCENIENLLSEIQIPAGEQFSLHRKTHEKYNSNLEHIRKGMVPDKKDTYKAGTFNKIVESAQKTLAQVKLLQTNVANKREKTVKKVVKKSNDPKLINPNAKLESFSFEKIIELANTRTFKKCVYETTQKAGQRLKEIHKIFIAFIKTFPGELKELAPINELIKETQNELGLFKGDIIKKNNHRKETGEDSEVDATTAEGLYQLLIDIFELYATLKEEYQVRKSSFEERQQVVLSNKKKHTRGAIVYDSLTERAFDLEYSKRYRLLDNGQDRWNSIVAEEKKEGKTLNLEYIGDDSSEAEQWDDFSAKMEDVGGFYDVWKKNKSDPSACSNLARSIQQTEPLLPAQYHAVNNPDDCNNDQKERDIEADSEELKDIAENFDVSDDHESESNYDISSEEEASSSSSSSYAESKKSKRGRDEEAEAAIHIVEAMIHVPVAKERNEALKHYKAENYLAVMEVIKPVFEAEKAYGFKMTNKKTKTSKEYDDWWLDPTDRDLNLEAWANRTEAFDVEPIEKNLKRQREESE